VFGLFRPEPLGGHFHKEREKIKAAQEEKFQRGKHPEERRTKTSLFGKQGDTLESLDGSGVPKRKERGRKKGK